jgi:hypothetical protein
VYGCKRLSDNRKRGFDTSHTDPIAEVSVPWTWDVIARSIFASPSDKWGTDGGGQAMRHVSNRDMESPRSPRQQLTGPEVAVLTCTCTAHFKPSPALSSCIMIAYSFALASPFSCAIEKQLATTFPRGVWLQLRLCGPGPSGRRPLATKPAPKTTTISLE